VSSAAAVHPLAGVSATAAAHPLVRVSAAASAPLLAAVSAAAHPLAHAHRDRSDLKEIGATKRPERSGHAECNA